LEHQERRVNNNYTIVVLFVYEVDKISSPRFVFSLYCDIVVIEVRRVKRSCIKIVSCT